MAGRATESPAHRTSQPIRFLGDYELLEPIGAGATGQVYRARQLSVNRELAVKVLHPAFLDSTKARSRFQNEVELVASLEHPNILPIFESGEDGGIRYFSMRLALGGSLADSLAKGRWKPGTGTAEAKRQRDVVSFMAIVAGAVHHAHQHGVIHRDLKPGNILLGGDQEPLIADFGFAKALDRDTQLTLSREVFGTPAYMAPEQFDGGRRTTLLSDVYSLGVILYELLTGRLPLEIDANQLASGRLRFDEPIPPTRLNPELDRDLAVICLHCLDGDPSRRYASAGELEAELGRWARHEPIQARPAGIFERAGKWAQRHRTVAVMLGVVFVTAIAGLAGILWQWQRALRNRELLDLQVVALRQTVASQHARNGDAVQALRVMALAVGQYPSSAAAATRLWSLVFRPNWSMPKRVTHVPFGLAADTIWSPDGSRLAVFTKETNSPTQLSIWDPVAGELLAGPRIFGHELGNAEFSPDGRWILSSFDRKFRMYDAATMNPVDLEDTEANKAVGLAFAWHPDSRRFAVVGNTNNVRLTARDAAGVPGAQLFPTAGPTAVVAISGDGRFLAASDELQHLRVWEIESRRLVLDVRTDPWILAGLSLSPNGDRILGFSGVDGGGAGLWALPEGRLLARFTNAALATAGWTSGRILLNEGTSAAVADAASGAVLHRWKDHTASFPDSLSRDGSRLALFHDKQFDWIDMRSLHPLGASPSLKLPANSVHLAPRNNNMAITFDGPEFEVWSEPHPIVNQRLLTKTEASFLVSSDGQRLVVGSGNRVELRLGPDFERVLWSAELVSNVVGLALAGTGARHIAAFDRAGIRVWEAASGSELARIAAPTNRLRRLAISPDGAVVAALAEPSLLWQWDVRSGQALGAPVSLKPAQLPIYGYKEPTGLAFSPDGKVLVVAGYDGAGSAFASGTTNRVWSAQHGNPIAQLAFTRDGTRMASAGMLADAHIWRTEGGSNLLYTLPHGDSVLSVDFSPDGRRLLTTSFDGKARVWDVGNGALVSEAPVAKRDGTIAARFAPDGWRYAAIDPDGEVSIWESDTGFALDHAAGKASVAGGMAWASGGSVLIAGGKTGPVVAIETPVPSLPVPSWVPEFAMALAGSTTNRSPARDLLRLRDEGLRDAAHPFWRDWVRRFGAE